MHSSSFISSSTFAVLAMLTLAPEINANDDWSDQSVVVVGGVAAVYVAVLVFVVLVYVSFVAAFVLVFHCWRAGTVLFADETN